ncbi:MAG TPA: NAD(P)-dependent oxidoreductase [Candidatus Saccharimonadales bacterium]|nr:NAD(P)-dependent oxidoreductase [Candidatus Saccharimonadales bacterium]
MMNLSLDESRILIVGAYGQLGKALQATYPKATAVDRDSFDMTDWQMLSSYDWGKYDVILNAAAYTNVDGAETDGRAAAWKINATGPGYLSKLTAQHNLTLVHVSTDYVFDGTTAPHTETEDYTPLSVYGQTKAAGDIAVSTAPKHYIVRVSWLIGDGPNFVRTMMGLAAKDISPTVVGDQIGRLTFTSALVAAIDHLLTKKPDYGTYNLSNDGEAASWADITRTIFKELGRDDLTVTDTTTKEYFASKPNVAPRPLKSELDLSKIKATGLVLRDWKSELHDYIAAEQAKPKE